MNQIIDIKSQIESNQTINTDFYEHGIRTFELSKQLYSQYVRANYEERGKILKLVASDFVLDGVSLYPTYRKPFNFIAEGLSHLNWLLG